MKTLRNVYVASLWYEDCDPFETIISYSESQTSEQVAVRTNAEIEWVNSGLDSGDYDGSDILGGAVHFFESYEVSDCEAELLRRDGFTYILT